MLAGQRIGSGCVKSQTYQGAVSTTQAGHAESTSKTFKLTKGSVVRGAVAPWQ